MKMELRRISPSGTGFFLGFLGFIASIPALIIAFTSIGPGKTVGLNGFVTLSFTGTLDPIALVFAYPFLNATGGLISGFLIAWLYNFYALRFGGISIGLNQDSN
jgi:hypothetical protein